MSGPAAPRGAGLGFGLAAEASCCLLQVFPMARVITPSFGTATRAHSWRWLFLPLTPPHPARCLLGQAAERGLGALRSHGEKVLALLTVSRRSTVGPFTFSERLSFCLEIKA